jgi:tryptophan synthase alpha chain
MSRIESKFKELKALNKKALITFITAGDPNLNTTKKLIIEMEQKGADLIELGIPYSDPIAEGPVIQRANVRALKNDLKIKNIMDAVRELRQLVKVPLLYLLYFNCILQYGPEKFFEDCRLSGIDGVIIPDLPFEEQCEIKETADSNGIDIITLVSPTSKGRIEKITKGAKGFLYCVSSLGVTGERHAFDTNFDEVFTDIGKYSNIPTAIGFGISTPEHIKMLRGYSYGLIVGSAIVKQVENSCDANEAVQKVGTFVSILRNALDAPDY